MIPRGEAYFRVPKLVYLGSDWLDVSPCKGSPTIIEYDDMTDEQKRIVDAGDEIAGTFPSNLSREELSAWIEQRFASKPSSADD